MAEYIPKSDLEIECEEILHNAEKEDFKLQQRKSTLETYFENILVISLNLVLGALVIFGLVVAFFHLATRGLDNQRF